ncbi:MAG: HNH endonuclease [Dethiobacter sp.]|nr:HNH endonuclease [Dethiobacter sp.]MBS3898701.1 HNH endonuclease [Dethiobacter sp.]
MNYKNPKWIRKRAVILRRDGYVCRECRRFGKTKEATTVHYILPAEERSDLAWENDNLLSLCGNCHDAMHDRNNNTLTVKGMEWVERLPPHLRAKN